MSGVSFKSISLFVGLAILVVGALLTMQSMLTANTTDLDAIRSSADKKVVSQPAQTSKMSEEGVTNIKVANLLAEEVSPNVIALAKNVDVVTGRIQVLDREMFYREALPPKDVVRTNQNALLLHGMNFKSQTWLDLGTITLLAAMGHRVVAVDLPGYGETGGDQYDEDKKGDFLNEVIVKLQLQSPFIVSPSMSGSYSLPYIFKYPGKIGAYIPVAPITTGKYTKEQYEAIQAPTLIIHGELDSQLGEVSAKSLRNFPNSQEHILPKAKHPAYLDQPDMFHQLLYNLFLTLKH